MQLIVTRTPLRISFAGGGTDLPGFYQQDFGAVFSTTISSYLYVTVKSHSPLFNEPIRLNYRRSEEVHTVDEIENDIARECLRFLEIEPPIYISTVADHPQSSGLGGSGAFAVGLLNALHSFRGERVSAAQLAEEACHIEIEVLGQPIGKQDQCAVAYGGLNFFRFGRTGNVSVESHRLSNGRVHELFDNLLLFWTGHQHDSSVILAEQEANMLDKMESLRQLRDHAHELHELMANGHVDLPRFGQILHEGWEVKRGLASTISTNEIDNWYRRGIEAGAEGGKLCGAGGGGCLLFVVKPEHQDSVRRALHELSEVPLSYEVHGSRVLLPTGD